jgi:hypothetical protein
MTFALIHNGTVAQLSAAQFPVASPLVWVDVTSVSPAPQPSWTATQTDGVWTFVGPVVPAPTLAQQAGAAISAGVTVTLSGSVTLAATLFPTDAATQSKLGAVITTLIATSAFPGGAATYPMRDSAGTWHTFTPGQYTKVAGAIAAYVAALFLIVDGNPMSAVALPSSAISLTV